MKSKGEKWKNSKEEKIRGLSNLEEMTIEGMNNPEEILLSLILGDQSES